MRFLLRIQVVGPQNTFCDLMQLCCALENNKANLVCQKELV